jgi:uncharacterized membrane protein YbaN (DUF454 family)
VGDGRMMVGLLTAFLGVIGITVPLLSDHNLPPA